ncbi:MAG: hypothetical protein AAF708_10205 [Deinococcota bacterium]
MRPDILFFSLLIIGGCLRLAVSIFNLRWYMNGHRGRFIAWLYGQRGARVFWGVLGGLMVGIGIAGIAGVF